MNNFTIYSKFQLANFKTGDHVKVIAGRHEGETGFIMKIEGTTATLFSDLSNQEIQILAQDVQECAEVATGKIQLGNYELHDLIQVNPMTVGMIVKIERDSFKVLDNNGVLMTISLQEAGRKITFKDASTFDAHSNTISVGDMVQVIDGPYKGKQGNVKRIYKYFVFVHSRQVLENSGIFVVRTGNVVMMGVALNKPKGAQNVAVVPQSPRHYTSGQSSTQPQPRVGSGRPPPASGPRRRQDNPIIGKSVTIKSGPYKGYVGIVKNATKTTARVELHTNCKTITLPLELLVERSIAPEKPVHRANFGDARTPMRPSDEGFQTPLRTMNTPMRPSTPSAGTAWDPSMPNTPMRPSGGAWDSNENSWSSGGWGDSVTTPFTPFSPAKTSASEQPTTPSDTPSFTPGGFGDARTPTPGTFDGTPALTPVMTPGQDATPDTEEVDRDWQTSDILVQVMDGPYINAEGVIKEVNPPVCLVQLTSSRDNVLIPTAYLQPVTPSRKGALVKIIRGPLKGKKGSLYGIEGGEAIVKMSTDLDIKILELHNLAILVEDN